MKRISRFLTIFGLIAAVITTGLVIPKPPRVSAANPADFNPGLIISDGVMANNNSMSAGGIQAFLNSKMPVCDTWGNQPYAGTTRGQYGTSRGNPPPYICLKDFNEGGISAAQIIWNKSQEFRINPQVLIVLLQKEQGLVTDDWPWPTQYRSATGYGCPDSTPGVCDSQYYGFTNQIHWAATLHRRILDQAPTWTNYYPPGVRNIQYNPNGSCGGTNINIANLATSALYNYTPYQPNAAAMANLYGTGDGCSAYGNRNFWRDFTDWFGNPIGLPFQWQWVSQTPLVHMVTGEVTTFTLRARNTGTATWSNSGPQPVRLGTEAPKDHASILCNSSWTGCNRAATLNESSVAPGQEGTFTFTGQIPITPGYYHVRFNLLAEGNMWMNDVGQYFEVEVVPATIYAGQSGYPTIINGGSAANVHFLYKNNTAFPWYDDVSIGTAPAGTKPLHFATSHPINRNSIFAESWPASNRPAVNFAAVYLSDGVTLAGNQRVAQPGQIVKFGFNVKATASVSPGTYREYFQPIFEGGSTLNDPDTYMDIRVEPAVYSWSLNGRAAYTDSSKTTALDANNLSPGQTGWWVVRAVNTGNQAWSKTGANPVHLGTERARDRTSGFYTSSWLSPTRPAALVENSVAPGQVGTFEFPVAAPGGGMANEHFNLVAEGITWLNDTGLGFPFSIHSGFSQSFVTQYAYTNSSKTTPVDMNNLSPGQRLYFGVKVRNGGTATWYKTGKFPLHLGTNQPRDRTSTSYDSSWLSQQRVTSMLEDKVAPGETATFEAYYVAPGQAGTYREHFNTVAEGITWLNDLGIYIPMVVK